MPKEVTAFVCIYCPRKHRFAVRGAALRHEATCFYNPIRRACATCKHFTYLPAYYEPETGYGEGGPTCDLGLFANDPEASTPLGSECDKWEAREAQEPAKEAL